MRIVIFFYCIGYQHWLYPRSNVALASAAVLCPENPSTGHKLWNSVVLFAHLSCLCCPILFLYVLSSMLWCPLRFPHKNNVRFVCRMAHVLFTLCVLACVEWCPTPIIPVKIWETDCKSSSLPVDRNYPNKINRGYINVREYQKGNQKWIIQRNCQYTRRR
jgi:hypothetical protein